MHDEETATKHFNQVIKELCSGPLYDGAKELAEQFRVFLDQQDPNKTMSNGQLVLVGAMISAMLMSSAPDEDATELAIKMNTTFVRILLKAMQDHKNQESLH